ncbi:MAG: WD40-repeat-containing domain protein [Linnemannia elongata]|nr:MAG: WD40-repeat-containing domain protein [Linnemannia elongata]
MTGVRFGELPYLKSSHFINSCSYSPDGRTFTIGLNNGDLELYDSSTWSKTRTFRGHTASVLKFAYSLSNLHLVSGGRDGTVRLWDVHSDQPRLTLDDYSDSVATVAFSPSGHQFASASGTTIWIRETKTGAHLLVFKEHTLSVTSVAFSPSGLQLASSSNDGTIRLWNLKDSSKPAVVFSQDHGPVYCIAFSPDAGGRQIVSGHLSHDVHIWDATTGEHSRSLSGHTSGVHSVTFSQDGLWIATSSADMSVRLWSAKSGIQLSVFEGHERVVSSVAISPIHQQIASCSDDHTVRLWDMSNSGSWSFSSAAVAAGLSPGQTGSVSCVAYSPDGQNIVTGGSDRTVWEWNASTGESSRPILTDYSTTIGCLLYSPDGKQIATAGYDTAVRLNDVAQRGGGGGLELWGHFGVVSGIAFSPCGQWIASSSFDATVRLWDTRAGTPGNILTGHTDGGATCVAYSPSGDRVAAGGEDGSIRIWDSTVTAGGETVLELIGHEGSVSAVAYAPVGQRQIASCGIDKTIRLWDALTGRLQTILRGHTGSLSCLSYSSCGGWLAVGAMNGVVYLWRHQQQQQQQQQPAESTSTSASSSWASTPLVIRAFHGVVAGIAWNSQSGRDHNLEFVTGCEDHSVRVWRVEGQDGGNGASVRMIWGSSSGRLVAGDANIQGAIGLAQVDKNLLLQRGAIDGGSDHSGEFYVEDQTV